MSEVPCVSFDGAFSMVELAGIIAMGNEMPQESGGIVYGPAGLRRCTVAWITDTKLRDKLWFLANKINCQHFDFHLDALERMQYAVYRVGDHYGWHIDKGPGTPKPRKLSLTVQLSLSSDYEGGDLQVQNGCEHVPMTRHAGALIAFPSWMPHRVTPVTRGERRSLTVWVNGPPFR